MSLQEPRAESWEFTDSPGEPKESTARWQTSCCWRQLTTAGGGREPVWVGSCRGSPFWVSRPSLAASHVQVCFSLSEILRTPLFHVCLPLFLPHCTLGTFQLLWHINSTEKEHSDIISFHVISDVFCFLCPRVSILWVLNLNRVQ